MIEEWVRWKPIEATLEKPHVEKLVNDKNGMVIVLKNDDEIIQFSFDDSVLSFRSTDEGRRLRTINFLDEKYGTKFYTEWTFFKVNNSDYIEWFNRETYDIYANYDIGHYVFLALDDIVEILSTYEPVVSIAKNKLSQKKRTQNSSL